MTTAEPQRASTLERVHSIPVVKDSLAGLHDLLSQNWYTATPYATVSSIGTQAYSATEPIQQRLNPVLAPIDSLGNRSLDFVEKRYPYPFHTPTPQIKEDLMKQRDQIYDVAAQTYDTRIKSPAYGLARTADQSMTPLVDILQAAYDRLDSYAPPRDRPTAPNGNASESQIQRAVRLGYGLQATALAVSLEQLHQLQQHNVVVQRVTDALYNLNAITVAAKDKTVAAGKDSVDRVQVEIAKLNQALASLPAHAQQAMQPVMQQVNDTREQLQTIISTNRTATDKASMVLQTVRHQLPPLTVEVVKSLADALSGAVAAVRGGSSSKSMTNGNGADKGSNGTAHN